MVASNRQEVRMIRSLAIVCLVSSVLTACESQQFGTLKLIKQPNSPFSKLAYIEPSNSVEAEAEVDPVTTAAPRPTPQATIEPDPLPVQEPAVTTSAGQGDSPTVITCEVC